MTTPLMIHLDEIDHWELKKLAAHRGTSMSAIVRGLIRGLLEEGAPPAAGTLLEVLKDQLDDPEVDQALDGLEAV